MPDACIDRTPRREEHWRAGYSERVRRLTRR
jgi:hypothetical protein